MAYETTGVVRCRRTGRDTVTSAPSSATGYALPGTLTPGGNSNLATMGNYTAWAVTSVTGPNGANGTTTYDSYGRPTQTKIPDGAETNYSYAYWPATWGRQSPDGNVGVAVEADDAGRVRAGDAGGDGARFDDGDPGGHAIRAVRVLAVGEGVAGMRAVRAGRDAGVDDIRL